MSVRAFALTTCIALATADPAAAQPTCDDLVATTGAYGAAMDLLATSFGNLLTVFQTLTQDSPEFLAQTGAFLQIGATPVGDAFATINPELSAALTRLDAACPDWRSNQ